MKNIKIRPLIKADCSIVEHICIETAQNIMKFNTKRVNYTLLMYNKYYTRIMDNSFVAVDSDDKPIGYVLCALDFDSYSNEFRNNELKLIKKQGLVNYISACSELKTLKKYSANYPAHLHIDILPQYQGRGIGTELVHTLIHHLKNMGVTGLMLTVSAGNKSAVSFYKKSGFKILSKGAGIVFGMKF